ncbi:transmembrane protein 214, partial [Nothoprocta perdicaria]|uniref:transmembrane protein 214 n=1 Tax=Nothoprocta perdicaria TaxID=30464 RepID=UPI000E1C1EE4
GPPSPCALPSPAAPIAPSDTLFELGFEKAARKQNKEQVPPAAGTEQPARRPPAGRGARKAAGAGAPRPGGFRTLEEALAALDVAELQRELDKSQHMFPENPSVWLKDLAGYLNYKLQAPKSDPALSQHPHDYPYCLVSRELRGVVRALLGRASAALDLFFDHCIYSMLQELDRSPGEALHGYRICIQAVLLERPGIATANLGKYLELLRSHQNRPAKCLSILWALGQTGFTDLAEGLKVWLAVMLPVLGIKALSPFAVAYLERLLLMHPNLTKGFGMIGPKDFFPLLDFAFMPNNSLPPSLQEQLRQLYPRLKVLAFGAKPEATLHTYFPSFLSRATPSCPPDMKRENLLRRMRGRGFPWPRLLLVALVFAAGFLVHDVRTQGSFQASSSARLLRSSGILAVSQQAWHKVSHCALQGYRWLQGNAPLYYSEAVAALEPGAKLLWAQASEAALAVTEKCSSWLSWSKDNLPGLIEWLQCRLPEAALRFAEGVAELLLFLVRGCLLPLLQCVAAALERAWQRCVASCSGALSWAGVTEQLASVTYGSWSYLHNTTLALRDWALAVISGR